MMGSRLLRVGDSERGFAGHINRQFERIRQGYMRIVEATLRNRPVVLTLWVIVMLLIAALAPWFAPFSPSEQFSAYVLKGPGAGGQHVLGTDEFGRDLLSRIIWGARITVTIGS
jgi:peptide/nickel transport system permease protein